MSEVVNIIDTSALATVAAQGTGNTSLASLDGKTTVCNTGAVTVAASALPTGAATSAAQATGNASLSSIDGKVTTCNTGAVTVASSALPTGAATAALQGGGLPSALASDRLKVDGSGVTQPVSGTVTANIGTSGSLALDATLTGGTAIVIAKGAAATGAAVSGNPVYVGGKDGSGNAQPVLVNASGVLQVSAAKGTSVSSTAASASLVVSASACLVSRISMQNGNGATRFCHAHNATSLPANGAVPVAVIIIGTTQTQVMSFTIPTDKFSTGCVVATSTTGPTLTIGSADGTFSVDLFPTNV